MPHTYMRTHTIAHPYCEKDLLYSGARAWLGFPQAKPSHHRSFAVSSLSLSLSLPPLLRARTCKYLPAHARYSYYTLSGGGVYHVTHPWRGYKPELHGRPALYRAGRPCAQFYLSLVCCLSCILYINIIHTEAAQYLSFLYTFFFNKFV